MEAPYIWSLKNAMAFAIDSNILGFENVDKEYFVNHIYTPRNNEYLVEKKLAEHLHATKQFFCLVGNRGSGKSSMLHWCQHYINTSQESDVHMTILNIKKLIKSTKYKSITTDNASRVFAEIIRDRLTAKYFKKVDQYREFMAWLLAGCVDDTDFFSETLATEFFNYSMDLMLFAEIDDTLPRRQRMTLLDEFFKRDKQYFRKVLEDINPLVRSAHIIQAAISLNNWGRLIFMFDNIDQIDIPLQRFFFDYVLDIHSSLAGVCSTGIAVRLENVAQYYSTSGGMHEAISIMLACNDAEFELLPSSASEHCHQMFQARYQLGVHIAKHEITLEEMDSNFRIDSELHHLMVEGLLESKVFKLANSSIRTVNEIYCHFLDFYSSFHYSNMPKGAIETLFYLWLGFNGNKYGIFIEDVVNVDEPYSTQDSNLPTSSLHHYLLTALLNLEKENGYKQGGVPLRKISDRLEDLGYSSEQVANAVRHFTPNNVDPIGVIKVLDVTEPLKSLVLNHDARFSLMPSGEVLVKEIYSKIGYVLGRAYSCGSSGSSTSNSNDMAVAQAAKQYLNTSYEDRLFDLLFYLTRLAKRHFMVLERVRNMMYSKHKDNWLNVYRANYGVDNKLQIERIIIEALKFYSRSDNLQKLMSFSKGYNAILLSLSENLNDDWKSDLHLLDDCWPEHLALSSNQ